MALNIAARAIGATAALAAAILIASPATAAETENTIRANSELLNNLSQDVRTASDKGRNEVARRIFDALASNEVRFKADSKEAVDVKKTRMDMMKNFGDTEVSVTALYSKVVDSTRPLKVPESDFDFALEAMHDTMDKIGILDREADELISSGVANSAYANYQEAKKYFDLSYEGVYNLVRTIPSGMKEKTQEDNAQDTRNAGLPSMETITGLSSVDVRRSLEAFKESRSVSGNSAVVEGLLSGGYLLGPAEADKQDKSYVMYALIQGIKNLGDPAFASSDVKTAEDVLAESIKGVSKTDGAVSFSDRGVRRQYGDAILLGALDAVINLNPVPKSVTVEQLNELNKIMMGNQAAKDIKDAIKKGKKAEG